MMCKCEEDYLMSKTTPKKCLKKVGKDCTDNGECYTNTCTSKKCACPNANENFSMKKMACVAGELLGAACSNSKTCYATNLECKSSKCECKTGFDKMESYDDVCSMEKKKTFGETCSGDAECNSKANLKCVGTPTKCDCKTPDYEKMKVPYTDDMGKVSEWDKCLNKSATMDVKKGEECTSGIYDYTAKFCAKNLKCMACGGSADLKCREKSSDPSGAVQVTFSLLAAIGCLALRKVLM